jgi:hypothetical protein
VTGDGECPLCRAPVPVAGTIEHAFYCPHENPDYRGREPLSREAVLAIARACEAGWDALRVSSELNALGVRVDRWTRPGYPAPRSERAKASAA